MKLRVVRLVGLLFLAVGFVAADGRPAESVDALPAGVSAQTSTLDGEVLKVDPVCNTVKVQEASGSIELLVKDQTEIFIDGARAYDVSQIPEGAKLKTFFRNNGDAARLVISSH
jgi:hypothetical protein